MADNNKAVGPLAAAKLVSLIKAETAKKYDKTGGKIDGSAEITGGLKVGGSSEFSSLTVGTPTGDNDAATKKYVDEGLAKKASTDIATPTAPGLMSAIDKSKLNGIEIGANKTVVDAELDASSTNPVQNKVVKAELDKKAGKDVATADADGLMSAEDKVKLDGIEDGATKTIVDDVMSDTSTNPVQNKVVKKYIDSHGVPQVTTQNDTMLIQVVDGAYSLRTKESIFPVDDALDTESKNAVENGVIARTLEVIQGHTQLANGTRDGLMSASDYIKLSNIESGATKTIVDATLDASSTNPVQNKAVKTALDGKAGTAVATASANGLMSKDDKTKLDGIEAGANKTTVDAALDAASENPVQNKAVKVALDGKLDKTGGTLTGNLRVTGALFSGDGLSFGTGENIHFTKAADDAGKLAHGAAGVDDTVPLARLKVASPTENDDAATKAYVDNNAAGAGAVRYDAAQTLEAAQQFQARQNINAAGVVMPQFQGFLTLAPENAPLGTGVGLSPSGSGNDFTLDISDVNEGTPTLLTGVKTPTDADTNAAATVEYVKSKVASGCITPHIGDNGNWYIGVTDTGKPSRGEKGDQGAAGKSAYKYAVEGGYTGTEAEFAAKLASGALVVTITDNNGTLSADKSFIEIRDAIHAGIPVYILYDGYSYPVIAVTADALSFGTIMCTNDDYGAFVATAIIEITQNGEVNDISAVVETLPNPNAITFTGAVTGSYDGSEAMTVNIPSAVTDAHINSLIDTKLGVIENGAY